MKHKYTKGEKCQNIILIKILIMITFLRVYLMLGTSPHVSTYLILTITLWSKYNYYPYFIDEQTKVHSSHSQDCSRQSNCKAWKLNPLPLKKRGQFLGPVSINISSICPRNVQKGSSGLRPWGCVQLCSELSFPVDEGKWKSESLFSLFCRVEARQTQECHCTKIGRMSLS